jgi:two-component system, response regulator PdtaR
MKRIVILVVEDELLIRMDIVNELQDRGFEVLEAADADEAIALLAMNLRIEVLFTDVNMPGSMDGLKLAAAVRDRWPPVKIIVTSGHQNVERSDLPSESLFFTKPYTPDAIAKAAQQLVV